MFINKLFLIFIKEINQIKISPYHSRINSSRTNSINDYKSKTKLYKSIFNIDSPSHVNLTEYKFNLDKYKLLHSDKNSNQTGSFIKKFQMHKKSNPLNIQTNFNNINNNYKNSILFYKNRLTTFSSLSNNYF